MSYRCYAGGFPGPAKEHLRDAVKSAARMSRRRDCTTEVWWANDAGVRKMLMAEVSREFGVVYTKEGKDLAEAIR